jgi:hypothetical protein
MATFEMTGQDGGTYQIDAPNEQAAVAAMLHATGQAQPSAAPSPAPKESGGLHTVDDYVRAIANGMTFGLADRAAAGMGALTGVGGQRGDYSGNLKSEQGRTDQFASESPVSSTVANIAGGVAVPLGAIGAAAKGATLGTKTLLGMGAGAGIGGVQDAVSSPDLTDIPQTARGAAIGAGGGALIGGVIPGGARIIGSGYNAVANAVRGNAEGVSRSATQHVIDALMADNPAKVQGELSRLGPDAMLADAGPALLGKAQGASLNSDAGRSVLQNALTARNQGTNDRIAGDVNSALGPAEDPVTAANTIRAHRSAVDAQNYPAAFAGAPPVDTSNLLAQLGPMIENSVGMERKALTNLRDMMTTQKPAPKLDIQPGGQVSLQDYKNYAQDSQGPTTIPQTSAEVLHKIKGEMDNVIQYDQPGLGIPAAALSRQQGALKFFRGQLNDTLEQQVPGYANANAASAALARRGDAVDLGSGLIDHSQKMTTAAMHMADMNV